MTTSDDTLPLFPESVFLPPGEPFYFESRARKAGYRMVAGVDEAGRGALAGPVVAAAVILSSDTPLEGVKDSKKMTEKGREKAFSVILHKALAVNVGVVSHTIIDQRNILEASLEAMKRAVLSLEPSADYILVDGTMGVPVSIPQKAIKKGDQRSMSISAASVIAKVYRDRIMRSFDSLLPGYGFLRNKGYGTADHLRALKEWGPSRIHRTTFRGVGGGYDLGKTPFGKAG